LTEATIHVTTHKSPKIYLDYKESSFIL